MEKTSPRSPSTRKARRPRQEQVRLNVPVPARHFQLLCVLYGNRLEKMTHWAPLAVTTLARRVNNSGWPEGALGFEGGKEEVHAQVQLALDPLGWAEVMRAVDRAGVTLTTFLVTALLTLAHHVPQSVLAGAVKLERN